MNTITSSWLDSWSQITDILQTSESLSPLPASYQGANNGIEIVSENVPLECSDDLPTCEEAVKIMTIKIMLNTFTKAIILNW